MLMTTVRYRPSKHHQTYALGTDMTSAVYFLFGVAVGVALSFASLVLLNVLTVQVQ
jgi:hypothetical protein